MSDKVPEHQKWQDPPVDDESKGTATVASSSIENQQIEELPLLSSLRSMAQKPSPQTCRICFSSSSRENLFSPCKCSGSIRFVHRSCLERWLEVRNIETCELCRFPFVIVKTRKTVWNWFSDPTTRNDRRNLLGDFLCFLCLTPLGFASFWICLRGSMHFYSYQGALIEALALMGLAMFLVFAYATWIVMSVRYHYLVWSFWNMHNWKIRVLPPPEATVSDDFELQHAPSPSDRLLVLHSDDEHIASDEADSRLHFILVMPSHLHHSPEQEAPRA